VTCPATTVRLLVGQCVCYWHEVDQFLGRVLGQLLIHSGPKAGGGWIYRLPWLRPRYPASGAYYVNAFIKISDGALGRSWAAHMNHPSALDFVRRQPIHLKVIGQGKATSPRGKIHQKGPGRSRRLTNRPPRRTALTPKAKRETAPGGSS